ncbi:MAG: competence protein ComFC [Candidatus Parcubacteria bacterium]|jgi:ComF family protein|nr:competence protein ComFC [Candidatus Parcubacteria bacterium]
MPFILPSVRPFMRPFMAALRQTVLDALFPLSEIEEGLMHLSPEQAFSVLPRAPVFEAPIPNVRAVFAYKDERVAKLVWMIKYKKSATAARIGAYALHRFLASNIAAVDANAAITSTTAIAERPLIIVPIPISPRRRRERGFNQCELLADGIKRLDASSHFVVKSDLLRRVHHGSRQTLKQRIERLTSAVGIFSCDRESAARLAGSKSKIVVIDDVITTGSTMTAALTTLERAGFTDISGLSLAH